MVLRHCAIALIRTSNISDFSSNVALTAIHSNDRTSSPRVPFPAWAEVAPAFVGGWRMAPSAQFFNLQAGSLQATVWLQA